MRQIPRSEVKQHRSQDDAWLVLRGKVQLLATQITVVHAQLHAPWPPYCNVAAFQTMVLM